MSTELQWLATRLPADAIVSDALEKLIKLTKCMRLGWAFGLGEAILSGPFSRGSLALLEVNRGLLPSVRGVFTCRLHSDLRISAREDWVCSWRCAGAADDRHSWRSHCNIVPRYDGVEGGEWTSLENVREVFRSVKNRVLCGAWTS